MSDPTRDNPSAAASVRGHLQAIARLLHEVPHLSPEAQGLLADLIDEFSRALEAQEVPPAELNHLAEHVVQLVRAAHRDEEPGILGQARDRLEGTAAALESRAPTVAGLTRRLIETLSDLGI
jgi:hypothetical protein